MIATDAANSVDVAEILGESVEGVRVRERAALVAQLDAYRNRVVLFGAGNNGMRALACLRSVRVEPLAFSDNRRSTWYTPIDNTPVLAPTDAANHYGTDALFVVTIWNASHRYAETKRQLSALGVRNIVPLSTVQWRFPETFLPFFSLDLPHRIYEEKCDVVRAGAIWADDASRAEFAANLRWRALGDFDALPERAAERQYFPDFFKLAADESFVDCGAFDGDTLRQFADRAKGRFANFLALEPSPDTYEALLRQIAGLPSNVRAKVTAKPLAVGERRETLRFDGKDGRNARISEGGAISVECDTIDAICAGKRVTYIKMDIEGAEGDALAGARETILRDRPVVAFCVYHRQTDLWRLPLFVHDLVPEYRMFLRSHERDGWETVAYAVPPERTLATPGSAA